VAFALSEHALFMVLVSILTTLVEFFNKIILYIVLFYKYFLQNNFYIIKKIFILMNSYCKILIWHIFTKYL
jgi:hypothetical protein